LGRKEQTREGEPDVGRKSRSKMGSGGDRHNPCRQQMKPLEFRGKRAKKVIKPQKGVHFKGGKGRRKSSQCCREIHKCQTMEGRKGMVNL